MRAGMVAHVKAARFIAMVSPWHALVAAALASYPQRLHLPHTSRHRSR